MAVLHAADALLDGLIAANIEWKQRQRLPVRISCCLHQLVFFLQVAHGGNHWEEEQREKVPLTDMMSHFTIKHFQPNRSALLHAKSIQLDKQLDWSLFKFILGIYDSLSPLSVSHYHTNEVLKRTEKPFI